MDEKYQKHHARGQKNSSKITGRMGEKDGLLDRVDEEEEP